MKIIDRIIEYGLYLLVFLLPIQTRLILRGFETGTTGVGRGIVEYPGISIYGVDILLIFLLILFCIKFFKNFNRFVKKKINKIQYFLVGMDLFIFISLFFTLDKMLGAYRYILFLLGTGLFWLIIKARYSRKKLFFVFFLSLFLQGTFAIWQFIYQKTIAFKWLGLANHFSKDLGASVIETFADNMVGERWLRAYGSFDHPNILGGVLAIGIIFLLWKFLNYKRQESKKTDYKFIIHHLSFIILFVALLFSFSRSSWLGLILSFIFLFLIFLVKRNKTKLAKIAGVIILFIVLFVIVFYSYSNLFVTRIGGEGRLEERSNYERSYYLGESKEIIKRNYLFGTGIGNYIVKAISLREDDYFWTYQPVHNTFILIFAEIGIFGFLFFAGFLLWLLIASIKNRKFLNIAILIALFTIMMFDHWIWSLHFGILFFWLIMGLLVKNLEVPKYKKETIETYNEKTNKIINLEIKN